MESLPLVGAGVNWLPGVQRGLRPIPHPLSAIVLYATVVYFQSCAFHSLVTPDGCDVITFRAIQFFVHHQIAVRTWALFLVSFLVFS